MKNLATALVKAQKAFSPALKNSTNPHFKSRYADLATCVEAVMDALNDNGIALIRSATNVQAALWLRLYLCTKAARFMSLAFCSSQPASKTHRDI